MKSLRLKNYRCFEDTGDIDLKPITLLVGANSTGKSSFLKFFPLLKQSAEVNTHGFFLWNGKFVEFLDFKNTVKDNQGEISFGFKIKELPIFPAPFIAASAVLKDVEVSVTLAGINKTSYDYVKELHLKINHNTIEIKYKEGGVEQIIINGEVRSNLEGDKVVYIDTFNFIPVPHYSDINHIDGYISDQAPNSLVNQLINEMRCSRETAQLTLQRFNQFLTSDDTDLSQLVGKENTKRINEAKSKKIKNIIIHYGLNNIIFSLNYYLKVLADNIAYIMPLRAMTERDYSFRNFSTDYIDADGRNLPMFLSGLSDDRLKQLNEWLYQNFSITIDKEPLKQSRIEIRIIEYKQKDEGSNEKIAMHSRNIIDMGFGYTQILPIIITIWNICFPQKTDVWKISFDLRYKDRLIVIEQPELHLHPRFQKVFADALVKICNDKIIKKNFNVKFIIETHSEYIINRIGANIGNGSIKNDMTSIVYFNDTSFDYTRNHVEVINYDDEGYIDKTACGFNSESDAY